jgi:hypothetical protein
MEQKRNVRIVYGSADTKIDYMLLFSFFFCADAVEVQSGKP